MLSSVRCCAALNSATCTRSSLKPSLKAAMLSSVRCCAALKAAMLASVRCCAVVKAAMLSSVRCCAAVKAAMLASVRCWAAVNSATCARSSFKPSVKTANCSRCSRLSWTRSASVCAIRSLTAVRRSAKPLNISERTTMSRRFCTASCATSGKVCGGVPSVVMGSTLIVAVLSFYRSVGGILWLGTAEVWHHLVGEQTHRPPDFLIAQHAADVEPAHELLGLV